MNEDKKQQAAIVEEMDLMPLCKTLGYEFKRPELLHIALQHRSFSSENNERLEFLGDGILNGIIAAQLFTYFSEVKEGVLTRFRAALVKTEALAQLGKELDIGPFIRLGPGELKTGGACRTSILADTFEAIIGAIYCDAGFDVCRDRVLAWYGDRLISIALSEEGNKDDKSQLQEWLQAKKLSLPCYQIDKITGKHHEQTFHVSCTVSGLSLTTYGSGISRRKAEQKAACEYLSRLKRLTAEMNNGNS